MIRNLSKNTVLCKEFEVKTGFSKIKGLMGEPKPKAIIFKTRLGLHTFFLKYSIDIIVLDKKSRVVFIKSQVKIGSFVFWNPNFDTVIEVPNGTIDKSKTKMGDKIEFIL